MTIVRYDTYLQWKRDAKRQVPVKKMGRPKTSEEIRELILKIARETGWGYTRIMGELKKLGLTPPSKTTVQNILRANGHDPGPKRGEGSWDRFLKAHAETLWQCDFFSKKILTRTGFRQVFVLAFINVATRRVIVSPCTSRLRGGWMKVQTEAFFEHVKAEGLECKLVMRDNDTNYKIGLDNVVRKHGAIVRPTAIRAPNENAYIERFVQTIKQECLDHFLVFEEKHFNYLVREVVRYYHECRPHQGLENQVIAKVEPPPMVAGKVECESRLGGLLKHYYRAA
ncbi:integrase core domain-containing protein [Aeoliella sp. SH292]|uniref:integrase core domain-containing protein n=1 Tax=Aeoliella sp. SH292 TaxID=3454464 RepID=UPI003F99E887